VRPRVFSGPVLDPEKGYGPRGQHDQRQNDHHGGPPVRATAWASDDRRVIGIDFMVAVFSEVFSSML